MDFWNALDTVIEPVYPSSSLFLLRFVLFSFSFFSSTCLGSTGHSTRFNYAPQDRSPFVLALSRDTRTSGRDLLCVPASFRFVPLSASSDRSSCPYSTLLNVVELKCGGSSLRCQFFFPLEWISNHEEPVSIRRTIKNRSSSFSLSLFVFSVAQFRCENWRAYYEFATRFFPKENEKKKKTLDSSSSSLSNKLLLSPFASISKRE